MESIQLTWKVLNAFSATMQQCHASILGANTGASAGGGTWAGPQTGTMNGAIYTGSATITPTAAGTYTYVLNCGGIETGSVTRTVGDGPTIVTPSLPNGGVGKSYSALVRTIGGTLPYKYSTLGTMPPGLTIDLNSGVVSGSPKQFGDFRFGIYVQDSAATPLSNTAAFSVTIANTLALSSALINPTLNAAYSASLLSTGGYGGYKFVVTAGKLPDGLKLNATTGILSGTPTTEGEFDFTVTLTDGENPAALVTQTFSVSTVVPPLAVTGGVFPACTVQVLCQGQLTATGGEPPYTWAIAPGTKFPPGLTLNTDGSFTGKPLQFDDGVPYVLQAQVTDAETPAVIASGVNELAVASGLKIVSISLPQATLGLAYAAPPPVASGGLPPYRWTIAPFDPGILNEYYTDPAIGALRSPGPLTAGSFHFTYKVTDSETNPAHVTYDAVLVVVAPAQTTTTVLSASSNTAGAGTNVTLTAKVSGSGAVPTGLVVFYNGTSALGTVSLDATGTATLTTTFSSPGTYSLTAAYSGEAASTGSISAPLTETVVTVGVSAAFSPGTLTVASGKSGTLTITLTPTGGYTGPVTFSCGQLPANVSCTFAPPSLTIAAGTTTATDTLTINTAATTSAALLKAAASTGAGIFTAGTLWLPASLLALLGMRRRSSRLPRLLAVSLLALSAGVITLTGCGSPTPTLGPRNLAPTPFRSISASREGAARR